MSIAAHLWLLLPRRTIGQSHSSSRCCVRSVIKCVCKRKSQQASVSIGTACSYGSTSVTTELLATWSLISPSRERYGAAEDPSKVGHLRHPTNINKLPQEAARRKNATRLADYAVDRRISFLPAVCSTWGRIDAELLRLLCHHAHRESEEFFKLTGQLAQPNQDSVFSKHASFFNGLKNKLEHIMAKASALRIHLNLLPSVSARP